MKRLLFIVISASLLVGCQQKPKLAQLYQEPQGGNIAKLRVRGFTDNTDIAQVESCARAHWLGVLRDSDYPERNPPKVVDRGYKKAAVPDGNAPLDYMEIKIPADTYIQVRTGFHTSDNQLCALMTPWFKPKPDALYEVRSELNKEATVCHIRTWEVNQETGAVTPITGSQSIVDVLHCKNFPAWQ